MHDFHLQIDSVAQSSVHHETTTVHCFHILPSNENKLTKNKTNVQETKTTSKN